MDIATKLEQASDTKSQAIDPAIRARINERGEALIREAGERYRNAAFQTFHVRSDYQRTVVTRLMDFASCIRDRRKAAQGLILYGPVGTGKDHLAFSVMRGAICAGQSVRWVNGQSWFGEVRDAMDDDTSEESLLRRLTESDWLVLSDPLPPRGELTQHQATMLYRLVEGRYAGGRPTVVTVNVAHDAEADRRIGAPTWDRLCHDAWKVSCNWPSYRKPAIEIKG